MCVWRRQWKIVLDLRLGSCSTGFRPTGATATEPTRWKAIRQTCKTIQVADAQVSDRVSLRRAFNEGLTVEEYRPADNRGLNEILSVYELAFGEESKNGNQA